MATDPNQEHRDDPGPSKEGMSVRELESFGKKYRLEIVFLVYFVLATIFSAVFFGMGWSIYLAGIGGILGIFFPLKIESLSQGVFGFVFKQERATQITLAVVGLIISFFLPPLIFFLLGLMGGMGTHRQANRVSRG